MFQSASRFMAMAAACLLAAPLVTSAAPTNVTDRGITSVKLAPSFLSALGSLGGKPGTVEPGRLVARNGDTLAVFPITDGALDLGTVKGEVDHAGGLSLTAGKTEVDLTAFAIEIYPNATPVLTGLVTVDGHFVGRLPLFDLSLSHASVAKYDDRLVVKEVGVALNPAAAAALSKVLQTNVPAGLVIGTATVRSFLVASLGH